MALQHCFCFASDVCVCCFLLKIPISLHPLSHACLAMWPFQFFLAGLQMPVDGTSSAPFQVPCLQLGAVCLLSQVHTCASTPFACWFFDMLLSGALCCSLLYLFVRKPLAFWVTTALYW